MNRSGQRAAGVIVLVILLMSVYGLAIAKDATLTNIIVTNTRDDLLVYLNVEGAFPEKVTKTISSGVPVTFTFLIELYRSRNLWLDKKIAAEEAIHTVRYDNLKKEYRITRSWDSGNTAVTKSFEYAKRLMTEVDSLRVTTLDKLEKNQQYQLRAKAELSRKTLPLYLHYVLFFVSMWDFETDWYTIDFIY